MNGHYRGILPLAVLLGSALAQDALFPVAGVVVDTVSGDVLKQVRVAIAPSDSVQSELASKVTGGDGRFQFTVHKGKYRLTAQRSRQTPQSFGSQSFGSALGVAIVVDSNQGTDNLVFRLFPPAAISGKVVDDAGEPVEHALVQLIGSSVVTGRKRVSTRGYVYTDDLGHFRFGPLPAAAYYLAATGKPWYSAEAPLTPAFPGVSQTVATADRQMAYAPVYYPNSSDPRRAAPVVLKPGEEFIANLKLNAVPGVNISIRCDGQERVQSGADRIPGDIVAQLGAHVLNRRVQFITDGIQGVESIARVLDFEGPQTNISVTPGHYKVRVFGLYPGSPLDGSQAVDVAAADAEVTVTLKPPATVTGTVQMENGDAKPMNRMLAGLIEETTSAVHSRTVTEDGGFRIPNVPPGRYRVFLAGVGGVFAKGILEDGTLKDSLVEIGDESPQPLKVVASSGVGRVKGFVYRAGKSVAGVMVAMIPENQTNDRIYYRGVQTGSDGSFDFQNVPPGDYRIFAVDDVELEYANPVAMRPYLQTGKPIKVEAQGSYTENIDIP
jgi:Carboxypeptidase regulatory-like domain